MAVVLLMVTAEVGVGVEAVAERAGGMRGWKPAGACELVAFGACLLLPAGTLSRARSSMRGEIWGEMGRYLVPDGQRPTEAVRRRVERAGPRRRRCRSTPWGSTGGSRERSAPWGSTR